MKAPLDWIQQFVNLKDIPTEKLIQDISLSIAEVESLDKMDIYDVRIGEIKSVKKIEKSNKLNQAQVDIGQSKRLSIIFGGLFPIKVGDRLPVAIAPTILPTGIKIEKREMFGIISEGMLVSDYGMGMNLTSEGILRFNKSTKVGKNIFEYLKFSDVLNLSITPNRADLLSVQGIARDLSAFYKRKFNPVTIPKLDFEDKELDLHFGIRIKCAESLKRYAAIKLSGLKNGPSPDWMQKRLLSVNLRPINAIVDCTNYCMLELGQPLHAFDYEKISEIDVDRGHQTGLREIIVRYSLPNEKFNGLDEIKRALPAGSVVIADNKKILALGGIIGEIDSAITENTTQIVLESAVFDPILIRKTCKALRISTDASYRFERGVDHEASVAVLKQATGLILKICGGKITSKIFDFPNHQSTVKSKILFTIDRYRIHTGVNISIEDAINILQKLGFQISKKTKKSFEASPPSWRQDIKIEEDIYEELLRINNFNTIPETFLSGQFNLPKSNQQFETENQIATLLASFGWQEVLNYSFYSEKNTRKTTTPIEKHIKLLNPLGPETSYLRASLIPGLLDAFTKNANNFNETIKLFEIGHTFQNSNHLVERSSLTGVIFAKDINNAVPEIRLAINQIAKLNNYQINLKVKDINSAHILINQKTIGFISVVEPEFIKYDRQKRKAVSFNIDLGEFANLPKIQDTYRPINPFPAIFRDVTFVYTEKTYIGPVIEDIIKQDDLISDVAIIDKYLKSQSEMALTLRISYSSDKKTLNDTEVNSIHQKVIQEISTKYNFKIK